MLRLSTGAAGRRMRLNPAGADLASETFGAG